MLRPQSFQRFTRRTAPFSARIISNASSTRARYATGEDEASMQRGVEALTVQGWELDGEQMGIQKTFYFRSYFKATSFVNLIAAESAVRKHHSVMTMRIGSVDVHWTTHNPRGLTQKDIDMAQHCDRGAALIGAVARESGAKCG